MNTRDTQEFIDRASRAYDIGAQVTLDEMSNKIGLPRPRALHGVTLSEYGWERLRYSGGAQLFLRVAGGAVRERRAEVTPSATPATSAVTQWRSPAGDLLRQLAGADGEPVFVAKDVCEALGLTNPSVALKSLDDDEKGLRDVKTLGGLQQLRVITEPGVYKLIARSRKPEARAFDRWVRHEVLPAIRKTGGYRADANAEPKAGLVRAPKSEDFMRLVSIVETLSARVESLQARQLPAASYEAMVEAAVADRFDELEARLAKLEAPPAPVKPVLTLCPPQSKPKFGPWFEGELAKRGVRGDGRAAAYGRLYNMVQRRYSVDPRALAKHRGTSVIYQALIAAGYEDALWDCADSVIAGQSTAATS